MYRRKQSIPFKLQSKSLKYDESLNHKMVDTLRAQNVAIRSIYFDNNILQLKPVRLVLNKKKSVRLTQHFSHLILLKIIFQ